MILLMATICLLFFLIIGLPVALSLLLAAGIGILMLGGLDLLVGLLSTGPPSALSTYELLTIPMFLLMAEFMSVSGISNTLFAAISAWTGRMRGGLGVATALTGAAFGAISGSSAAAAATGPRQGDQGDGAVVPRRLPSAPRPSPCAGHRRVPRDHGAGLGARAQALGAGYRRRFPGRL